MSEHTMENVRIGWAQADLTPDRPVLVAGQFHARVSESVLDPITATALALESADARDHGLLVNCDLVTISDELRDAVRDRVRQRALGLDPVKVFLNGTHTHTGPEVRVEKVGAANVSGRLGIELDVMDPADYLALAAERIAAAVEQAWKNRTPGGVSFGLGHAVVGHNRRWTAFDGVSTMYGNANAPGFSHIEGYEDHSVNLLCTCDPQRRLTGLVVNLACPSQVSESAFVVSADFWHEARQELRRRLGPSLFVLPQCSAAADQSPHHIIGRAAEDRMFKLKGRTQREEIGVRIADAVTATLWHLQKDIAWQPAFAHHVETVEISRRLLTEADVAEALAEVQRHRERYEAARRELESKPELRQTPRWYVAVTREFRRARWFGAVAERYELQKTQPKLPVEVHVIRLGDMAFATNPFEYFLDFGMQIKARSRAVQTFVVHLTGSGTYVPTARAVAGRSYGAIPASTPIGPEGGRELAARTVDMINALWDG